MSRSLLLKFLAVAALTAVGAYALIHYDLLALFAERDRLIAFVESFGALSVLVFVLVQILQVLAAPIPGEVTGFIGGYLYGPVLGTLYSTVGLTIGSWIAFTLARWFGLPFVEKVVSRNLLTKYDYFMMHKGRVVAFVFFVIPGFPKDALCYIIGLSHMPAGIFLAICTVGRLLGTAFLSVSGDCFRNNQHEALWILAGVAGAALAAAYFFRERWMTWLRHHHHGHDGPSQVHGEKDLSRRSEAPPSVKSGQTHEAPRGNISSENGE